MESFPVELLPLVRRCLRCGHVWIKRKAQEPIWCPACNSPYWDRPRRRPAGVVETAPGEDSGELAGESGSVTTPAGDPLTDD